MTAEQERPLWKFLWTSEPSAVFGYVIKDGEGWYPCPELADILNSLESERDAALQRAATAEERARRWKALATLANDAGYGDIGNDFFDGYNTLSDQEKAESGS